MKNETEKLNNEEGNGVLPCVSGSAIVKVINYIGYFAIGWMLMDIFLSITR